MEMRSLLCLAYLFFSTLSLSAGVDDHLKLINKQDEVDISVQKGLAYLSRNQSPNTGAFHGELPNTFTALACIAYMAAGEQPGRTPFGESLKNGIHYLLRSGKRDKYYYGKEGKGRMYAHGIVTLALCEAYGMMESDDENRQIKIAIEKAIEVIIKAQCKSEGDNFGGWRYEPRSNQGADLSVSVWQALVLRSAKNSQLHIPDTVMQDTVKYIKATFNKNTKSFTYQGTDKHNTPAMNAAGVVAMSCLGLHESDQEKQMIKDSSKFLEKLNPKHGSHYYYMCYYVGAAANMLGDKTRNEFLPKLNQALMSHQLEDGQFKKHGGQYGGVYSTAFAVFTMCMRYQYLPIYQE